MLKNKRPKAVAMLGDIEDVKALIGLFEEYDIKLICENYNTIEATIKGIKEHKAEYVLVSDEALEGIENGKYEVIKQIRNTYEDVFVVMFFNRQKYDEQFRNWAFGFSVYNIYYAIDKDGNFNFSKIMPEIKAKLLPFQKNAAELEKIEKEKSYLLRQIEEKEKEYEKEIKKLEKTLEENKRLLAPAQAETVEDTVHVDDIERRYLYEQNQCLEQNIENLQMNFIREQEEKYRISNEIMSVRVELEAEKEKNARLLRDLNTAKQNETEKVESGEREIIKHMSKLTIGVFSVSRGAGATRTAIELAERLVAESYKVIVIAFDGRSDLAYLKKGKADYAIADMDGSKEVKLLMAHRAYYDFIILDFGMLFPVTSAGDIDTVNTGLSDNVDEVAEFLKCHYKIGVGFSDEWHFEKLKFYVSKDMFGYNDSSIFVIEGIENLKNLGEIKRLNLCGRNNDVFFEIFCNLIGITQGNHRNQKKKIRKR